MIPYNCADLHLISHSNKIGTQMHCCTHSFVLPYRKRIGVGEVCVQKVKVA